MESSSFATKRAVYLVRASRPDVAQLPVVRRFQVADEAVSANRETPDAVWNCARDQRARFCGAAAENPHVIFLPIHDLERVDRQAVARIHARNSIDGNFVVAGRRTHHALRGAAPDADGIRRYRRSLRKRAMREQAYCREGDEIR